MVGFVFTFSPVFVLSLCLFLCLFSFLFLYWLLVVTEGVYLGTKVVVLLYDWSAKRYNKLKGFNSAEEDIFLGEPLSLALAQWKGARVLDVATGTGRLPITLLRQARFEGRVVGLDMSKGMLEVAKEFMLSTCGRLQLVRHNAATPLPFADGSFHAVTCMEALEFLPEPTRTLREMARVLKEGGCLLITNRVGLDAKLMPGKTWRDERLVEELEGMGFVDVRVQSWQVYYTLVWARRRPGAHVVGISEVQGYIK